MSRYRVLLADFVDGKKFEFAIFVEAENKTGSETLAQYGYTTEDGARCQAGYIALDEFPGALLVETVRAPRTLDELLMSITLPL